MFCLPVFHGPPSCECKKLKVRFLTLQFSQVVGGSLPKFIGTAEQFHAISFSYTENCIAKVTFLSSRALFSSIELIGALLSARSHREINCTGCIFTALWLCQKLTCTWKPLGDFWLSGFKLPKCWPTPN